VAELYLGLMSGTSADGIDAVLAEFQDQTFVGLRGTHHLDYEPSFRQRLIEITLEQPLLTLRDVAVLDADIARQFAEAANQLLSLSSTASESVRAIGSHGQTVFHDGPAGLTIQLGDANRISELTRITTVADFRRRDLALGGQGAPLVPAFHHALFADPSERRCVVNIGGIANITLLPSDDPETVRGFDTGPGNGLLDEWIQLSRNLPYDKDGEFAATGSVSQPLLDTLLADPFFAKVPPKSTGRDYFRIDWARRLFPHIALLAPADVQRSLCELTAASVSEAISQALPSPHKVLVCGGGSRNGFLMSRLSTLLPESKVVTTSEYGLAPDWVEATAFAWLAMRSIHGMPGNLPRVTGARGQAVLGAIHPTSSS